MEAKFIRLPFEDFKTLVTVGQNHFFLKVRWSLILILGMEPKNQVNQATRSRVMATSEFSSERAK